jgi:hypothetical protein
MGRDNQFRMTNRRRDTLAVVRGELVRRDLEQGCWLINDSPARRWHGRTLSELEQAGLIEVVHGQADPPRVILTLGGEAALNAPN